MKTCNSSLENETAEVRKAFFEGLEPQLIADDFPMFVSRQELVRYLVRYELFKKILDIKGSVVECGVYRGASLMLFARLSAIYEPYAFKREVIGFSIPSAADFPMLTTKTGPLPMQGTWPMRI